MGLVLPVRKIITHGCFFGCFSRCALMVAMIWRRLPSFWSSSRIAKRHASQNIGPPPTPSSATLASPSGLPAVLPPAIRLAERKGGSARLEPSSQDRQAPARQVGRCHRGRIRLPAETAAHALGHIQPSRGSGKSVGLGPHGPVRSVLMWGRPARVHSMMHLSLVRYTPHLPTHHAVPNPPLNLTSLGVTSLKTWRRDLSSQQHRCLARTLPTMGVKRDPQAGGGHANQPGSGDLAPRGQTQQLHRAQGLSTQGRGAGAAVLRSSSPCAVLPNRHSSGTLSKRLIACHCRAALNFFGQAAARVGRGQGSRRLYHGRCGSRRRHHRPDPRSHQESASSKGSF